MSLNLFKSIFVFCFSICHLDADELLMELKSSSWYDDTPDNYGYEIKHNSNELKSRYWTSTANDGTQQFHCHFGREYKTTGSLTDHQRWECGKVPSFQCPYCDYCAKRKKHLRRHVICVHNTRTS